MAHKETSSLTSSSKAKFLIAFGILWLIAGIFYYKDDKFTASLPDRCTEPAVAKIYDTASDGIANFGKKDEITTGYITYKVDGVEYSSTFETKEEIQKGETVDILYDPTKPAVFYPKGAEINQGVDISTKVVMGIGGMMIVIGGVLLAADMNKKAQKRKQNAQYQEKTQ